MLTRLAAIIAVLIATIAVTLFGLSQASVADHPGKGHGHECDHHPNHIPPGHTECTPSHTPTTAPSPTGTPTGTPTTGPSCPTVNFIRGTKRRDVLTGTECRDVMLGHGGNDSMSALGGNDALIGGRGDDMLVGGTGRDIMRGGFGRDLCIGEHSDRFIRCERIRYTD